MAFANPYSNCAFQLRPAPCTALLLCCFAAVMSTHSFSDDDENDALAQLEAKQQALQAQLDAQQGYAAQLAALQPEEVAARPAPSNTAAADVLAAENAKLKAQLAALESASATRSTVRRDSEYAKQKADLDKVAAQIAKLTEALATGVGLSKLTTLKPGPGSVVAASKARSAALVHFETFLTLGCVTLQHSTHCCLQSKSLTKSSVARSDMRSVLRDLDTREKGVDICLLMDGTGSMVSFSTLLNFLIIISMRAN